MHKKTLLALAAFVLAGCATPGEMGGPVDRNPPTLSMPDGSYQIRVDARAGWVTTSLDIKEGDTLRFTAEGEWGESPGVSRTPDGGQAGWFGSGYWGAMPVKPDAPWGSLVGRIGGGPPFLVGSVNEIKADRDGLLQLSINDDLGSLSDNHGSVLVHITLRHR